MNFYSDKSLVGTKCPGGQVVEGGQGQSAFNLTGGGSGHSDKPAFITA